jgi:hypothetical protein
MMSVLKFCIAVALLAGCGTTLASPIGGVGDINKTGPSPHMSRGFLDLPPPGPPAGERLNEAAYEFTRYRYPHLPDSDGVYRPLAWCFGWRGDCGKNVADAFCKMMDPSRPVSRFFVEARGLGTVRRTVVIGTLDICDANSCSGFSVLDCVAEGQGTGRQPRRGNGPPRRPGS